MPRTFRSALCLTGLAAAMLLPAPSAEAARPRRSNSAQVKKMQEQMKYLQQDTQRYQREVAAKEREIFNTFDDNKNGHLEGGEKARFDKYMHAVQQGREPNPLSSIAPVGKGPKDGPTGSGK